MSATVHVCVCACTALKGSDPRGLTVSKEQSEQSKCHSQKTESASSLGLVASANIHKHTAWSPVRDIRQLTNNSNAEILKIMW